MTPVFGRIIFPASFRLHVLLFSRIQVLLASRDFMKIWLHFGLRKLQQCNNG